MKVITLKIRVSDQLAKAIAWNINDGKPLSKRELAQQFRWTLEAEHNDLLASYRWNIKRG